MATLALITIPTATQALPVRGALGSLGARARAAKRAAHFAQMAAAAEPVVEQPVVQEARSTGVRKSKVIPTVEKRESTLAERVVAPVEQFKARAIRKEFPNPKAFLVAGASTVADHVDSDAKE